MTAQFDLRRRAVLRGMLGGTAVTVALPLLDCMLNANGTALAAGGVLPVCFGTWFQGLGYNPGFWEPKIAGANYDFGVQLQPLTRLKHKINVYSGLKVFSSGIVPVHTGGQTVGFAGGYPKPGEPPLPTIDTLIGEVIGKTTRFRSIEVACDGTPISMSRRSGNTANPSEFSPVALYTRIFGPEYKDPNAANFTPDPKIMVQKSALSAVSEQRHAMLDKLGAADRARLDQFFTSVRDMEHRLEFELQKPAPMEACAIAQKPGQMPADRVIDDVLVNNTLFGTLLAHALACGQTRIFNLNLGGALSQIRRADSSDTFHTLTHEEGPDPKLGYQKEVAWFQEQVAKAFYDFVKIFDDYKEGDHTLLDRMVVLYATDHGNAKLHSNENIPMLTAGSGGGRLKTGYHLAGGGDTMARVGLTVQQALGVSIASWGTEGNQTSRAFTEIMV